MLSSTFVGMDKTSGQVLSGLAHLRQSIEDILTTPIGSRVMRRDYGSSLYQLVDQPYSAALVADVTVAIAEALERWEPRFALDGVQVDLVDGGKLEMEIQGRYLVNGKSLNIEGIQV